MIEVEGVLQGLETAMNLLHGRLAAIRRIIGRRQIQNQQQAQNLEERSVQETLDFGISREYSGRVEFEEASRQLHTLTTSDTAGVMQGLTQWWCFASSNARRGVFTPRPTNPWPKFPHFTIRRWHECLVRRRYAPRSWEQLLGVDRSQGGRLLEAQIRG